ncbi:MAG: glycosyltransferase [Magnetococcus sp. DMHC-6]
MDQDNPLVSVIIPAYQASATIGATVASLVQQRGAQKFEVIVVNSSLDETGLFVRQRMPEARVVQLTERTLQATARNIGARLARGKLLAFLDADCLAGEDWLKNMLAHYDSKYVGVGGPIGNANPESLISEAGYLLEFSEFLPRPSPIELEHIPSGNILVDRERFLAVGGFPQGYAYAQEDRLLSYYLTQKFNARWLFHPDIQVEHRHRTHVGDFFKHQMAIGRGGAAILTWAPLSGYWLVRRRWLVLGLVVLLPWVKLMRCLGRAVRHRPGPWWGLFRVVPWMVLGQMGWMIGFVQIIIKQKNNVNFETDPRPDF